MTFKMSDLEKQTLNVCIWKSLVYIMWHSKFLSDHDPAEVWASQQEHVARHLDVDADVLPPGQVHQAGAGAGLDHALARQQRDRPDAVLGRLDLLEIIESLNWAHLTSLGG